MCTGYMLICLARVASNIHIIMVTLLFAFFYYASSSMKNPNFGNFTLYFLVTLALQNKTTRNGNAFQNICIYICIIFFICIWHLLLHAGPSHSRCCRGPFVEFHTANFLAVDCMWAYRSCWLCGSEPLWCSTSFGLVLLRWLLLLKWQSCKFLFAMRSLKRW